MTTEPKSNAWQQGRDAARAGSHRKPRANASARWQAEYQAGWAAGHAEALRTYARVKQEQEQKAEAQTLSRAWVQ